jgi:hypothetical protein
MNATYLLVGVIVGVAILAMLYKQQNRFQGDWQVQGNALSFGMENFDSHEPMDQEVVETDEHAVEHMAQGTPADKITKWTPELEAEKQSLQDMLASPEVPSVPAVPAVPAAPAVPAVTESFELEEELEGFEGGESDMKMPYLGMEYASI